MKKASTLIMAIFGFLLSTGCDETKKAIDVAGSIQLSGTYTISTIGDEKLKSTAPSITFSAIDKSVRGTTGCNSFFANYTIDLYALDIKELAVTEMYCEDKDIQKTEKDFLDALKNTGSFTIENNILTLFSKNDRSILAVGNKKTNQ